MNSMLTRSLLLGFVAGSLLLLGCTPSTPPAKPKVVEQDPHEEHGHSHAGPHGGHVAEVGKDQFHVEWTHNDATGKVTLYVLDADGKKEVPVAAEKLVIVAKHGEKSFDYELAAVDPAAGKTAKFEIIAQDLIGTLEALSKNITAEIKELEINGEKFAGVKLVEVVHHDHH